MIGIDLQFKVNIDLFNKKEITDSNDILQVKEAVGSLENQICELLYQEFARTELDSVEVKLDYVNYLEPDDLEIELEIN